MLPRNWLPALLLGEFILPGFCTGLLSGKQPLYLMRLLFMG